MSIVLPVYKTETSLMGLENIRQKKTTPHGTGAVNSKTIIWANYCAKRGSLHPSMQIQRYYLRQSQGYAMRSNQRKMYYIII
jgi:hypothetical protein